MHLRAVVFDLDGVITDTAEYHYRAWQRLADEEGLPFDRVVNEALRGVSRLESLNIILNGRDVPADALQEMMARKNRYYIEMLDEVTPADILPGIGALLDELDATAIPYALASASKNASRVLTHLGLDGRFAFVGDGHCVERAKPAPDLFRYVAAQLDLPPAACLVVEDAAAGIQGALTAGMAALAIGPAERFTGLGSVARRDDTRDLTLADLRAATQPDPTWTVIQEQFVPAQQHHMETVFTLGNGYFASRGAFEEGYPGDRAITFAHGIFDDMPVSFTELVNLPDWLDLMITVDGHDFRLDQGALLAFERLMDLRQGVLRRQVRWQAPSGAVVDLLWERFASYAHEHLGALRVLATAVNRACSLTITAGIDGHVANEDLLHWQLDGQGEDESTIWLRAHTRHTRIDLATAAVVHTTAMREACRACAGQPRIIATQQLAPGETAQLDKIVAYASGRDPQAATGDVVTRARAALTTADYDALKAAQTAAWQALWRQSDVIIEGDDEAQLAVRFNLFQLLVAAPQRDERVSIGAKTLSGYGYRGHVFWDTEIFILPFFIYTQPAIARNMLMYRYHTLGGARQKAVRNGFPGAQYAWESAITGEEVTPTWVPDPADRTQLIRIWTGDIQIHISADIAYAIMQYWRATGDDAFLRDYGAEIILDTARFWGGRAEREATAVGYRYAFRNVIGPDEYHDHVDNNSFTNYVARWHLQTALAIRDWLAANAPQQLVRLSAQLDLSTAVYTHWQDVIDHTVFLYNPQTGLIDQFEGFFERLRVDPAFIAAADRSLQLIFGIEGANERQVLKQADVIMLLCLFRDQFDHQTWQANWDAYMPITDHRYGSSLGPSFHAWAACEMARPDEAYDHFMLAARADLYNPRGNAGDGIHAASAGGLWQAVVFGFAGLRQVGDDIVLRPQLPAHWQRIAFTVQLQGVNKSVDIRRNEGEWDIEIT